MPYPRQRAVSFRSGLEDALAADLKAAGVSFGYEAVTVPYLPTKPKKYTPDFILGNGIVIETKGYFVSADRSKHLLIQQQHPDLDIRFIFSRPQNRLGKQSQTTYAKWATDHGFQWAARTIPQAWLDEPLNLRSLTALKGLGYAPALAALADPSRHL